MVTHIEEDSIDIDVEEPIVKIKVGNKWLDLVEEEAAIVVAVLGDLVEAIDQALQSAEQEEIWKQQISKKILQLDEINQSDSTNIN